MSLIRLQGGLRAGRPMVRTLLMLLALTSAVIFGLLAMHSLNTHGLGSHSEDSTAALVAVVEPAHIGDHHSTVPAGDPECADCGTGNADMTAMACVLALLVAVLLLARPRHTMGWWAGASREPTLVLSHVVRVEPRPPSLDVLCISRT